MTIELIFEKTTEGSRKPKWKRILEEPGARETLKKRRGNKKNPNRVSVKYCDRCDELFKTTKKYCRLCEACKKPAGRPRGKVNDEK